MNNKISDFSISVVVPAYNEETEIEITVREIFEYLDIKFLNAEILVMNDGSKDNTLSILKTLAEEIPMLKVLNHEQNMGIGRSMRDLYFAAEADYIFFVPADRQVRIEALDDFLPLVGKFDILSGWRTKREDPFLRIFNQKLYHLGLRLCFGIKLHDVDCIKMYPSKLFKEITLFADSAFQEAEILYKALRLGYKIGDVPVVHYPRVGGEQTGAKLSVVLRAIKDFLKFFFILSRRK